MSNSHAKSHRGAVKNMRQGIFEQHPVHGKKHIKRPYKIVCVVESQEVMLGHYADRADAEKGLVAFLNKGYYNAHIVAPGEE